MPRSSQSGQPARRTRQEWRQLAGDDPATTRADRPAPAVLPVRRWLSLAIGGFAALLMFGLIIGSRLPRSPLAAVVFGVQVLFILAWTVAMRPPGPRVVAVVGVLTAIGADLVAVRSPEATLAPIGYVMAAAFALCVIGQLARRRNRVRVTDSLGSSLAVVVGVVAYTSLIVLTRKPGGTEALLAGLLAAGVSVLVARLADSVLPYPRMAPQVPRGAVGVIVGAMTGTAVAAIIGRSIDSLTIPSAVVVGFATAICAVATDLAVGYAEAGRELAGEPPTMWLARHMQGPLGAFALAAPATYILSVLFLWQNL